jgi:branched-chain amino acid transport system permease protein
MPSFIDFVSYGSFFLVFATLFAVIVLGLNLQWGFTGLFNVGVAGFVAIGAYTSALLTTPDVVGRTGGLGWPVVLGWIGAMTACGVAGLLVGLATLRLRHDYLAITTFGIAVTVQLVALNAQWLTGGPFGVQFIPKPMQGCSGCPTAHSSASCAAPGGVCCAPSAKTRRPPRRWANRPLPTAFNRSSSGAC